MLIHFIALRNELSFLFFDYAKKIRVKRFLFRKILLKIYPFKVSFLLNLLLYKYKPTKIENYG